MCRKIVFCGTCTTCGKPSDWEEYSQELPCLEAKNNGIFGECKNGIDRDEKPHDQECLACEMANGVDEGYDGGMEDEETLQFVDGKKNKGTYADSADGDQDESHRKKKQRTT
ncbi:hypothetical protein QBC38DRAFT_362758 [Podospora fimiseda]|uniref:Uncharacterized protein n=1 Tax=Podospora fimiseda TaxID=252190 RepID=A0AAN7BR99_9PEZI|nr:hypothetical protein QBC38DRAFT_362758 [Podospora fimiseda]